MKMPQRLRKIAAKVKKIVSTAVKTQRLKSRLNREIRALQSNRRTHEKRVLGDMNQRVQLIHKIKNTEPGLKQEKLRRRLREVLTQSNPEHEIEKINEHLAKTESQRRRLKSVLREKRFGGHPRRDIRVLKDRFRTRPRLVGEQLRLARRREELKAWEKLYQALREGDIQTVQMQKTQETQTRQSEEKKGRRLLSQLAAKMQADMASKQVDAQTQRIIISRRLAELRVAIQRKKRKK